MTGFRDPVTGDHKPVSPHTSSVESLPPRCQIYHQKIQAYTLTSQQPQHKREHDKKSEQFPNSSNKSARTESSWPAVGHRPLSAIIPRPQGGKLWLRGVGQGSKMLWEVRRQLSPQHRSREREDAEPQRKTGGKRCLQPAKQDALGTCSSQVYVG